MKHLKYQNVSNVLNECRMLNKYHFDEERISISTIYQQRGDCNYYLEKYRNQNKTFVHI